jgi:hypothetical protein
MLQDRTAILGADLLRREAGAMEYAPKTFAAAMKVMRCRGGR